jgi:hypothetical protein
MNETLRQILESAVLLILLFIGKQASPIMGGVFAMVISATKHIPKVGRLFDWLLSGILKFYVIAKLIAWLLSSSGLLLGLAVHFLIWGPLNHPSEFLILFFVAIVTILDIVYDIITFRVYYLDGLLDDAGSAFGRFGRYMVGMMLYATPDERRRVARATFVDMYLPHFFTLLVSLATIYYCLGELRLITVVSEPFSLEQALLFSFSLNDLIDVGLTQEMPYEGPVWRTIHIFASFIIFLWLIFFITIASSGIDERVTAWEEVHLKSPWISSSKATPIQENLSLKNEDSKTQNDSSDKGKVQETNLHEVKDTKEKTT